MRDISPTYPALTGTSAQEISFFGNKFREEVMWKNAVAILALIATPVLAQDSTIDPNALKDCPPIGQTAKGELIYGMDCAALKPENRKKVLSTMPPTNLPNTVIPKSGGNEKADDAPITGEPK